MAISGQIVINIGAQNEAFNSDSLFVAFNKIENNFNTLFNTASPYNTFVGNAGIGTSTNSNTGQVTITNTGVVNMLAGTGIGLSRANGNVVISVIGDSKGNLVAGVTRVGVISNTLSVSNTPVISTGNIKLELATINSITPGEYIAPTFTVDTFGRITNIASTNSVGTVTSVAIQNGSGIGITGGPITTNGAFRITNTGVTKINQGPGITLTGSTGEITISASLAAGAGTVSRVTAQSSSLVISNPTITTAGNIDIELPTDLSVVGNITSGKDILSTGNLSVTGNIGLTGALAANIAQLKIPGGTNGFVLQTDGTGNLSWSAQTGGSGTNTAAAGSNTQVQFNDGGILGGSSDLTFNKTTGKLSAAFFSGNGANLTNINPASLSGDIDFAATANLANFAVTVTGHPQPNITSVGTLTSLSVSGNISLNNANVAGNLNANGWIKTVTAANTVSNTQVATTEFVQNVISTKAPLSNPAFTGTPTAPTANAATVLPSDQIATLSYVASQVNNQIPVGVIVMWSGAVASVPSGWKLCDGTNSTPDLRGRFIVGAGGTYAVNNTGGTADAVVVSHTHTATVSDPGHTHIPVRSTSFWNGGVSAIGDFPTGFSYASGSRSPDGDLDGSRVVTGYDRNTIPLILANATTGVTVTNSTIGVTGVNQNLPPYYALCYIMKG